MTDVLRWVRGLLLLVGLVGMSALLSTGVARAHTDLVRADPAPGDRLDTALTTIHLSFDSTLVPDLARVAVRDSAGADHVTGRPAVLGGDLSVPVSGLGAGGSFQVVYRVVAADGHPVADTYGFEVATQPGGGDVTVQAGATAPVPATATPAYRTWAVPVLALLAAVTVVVARVRVAVRGRAR